MSKLQLVTERLILRSFLLTDAQRVQSQANDKRIYDTTARVPFPYKIEMAEQWIKSHDKLFENRCSVNFAIVTKLQQLLIGTVGLEIDSNNGKAELGYWVGVDYWNQGYCTEAAFECVKYGFQELGLTRIEGICMTKNIASEKVLKNIGMKREGVLRRYMLKNGISEDAYIYSVLNDERDI